MATAERRLRMKYSLGKHFEEFGSLYMYEGSTTLKDEYVKANDKSFNELLNNSFNINDIISLLENTPGLVLQNDPTNLDYPGTKINIKQDLIKITQ